MKQYNIDSIEAMQEFFSDIINIHHCSLHPDDLFADMVDGEDRSTFESDVEGYLDSVMTTCFAYCERHGMDIYAIASEVQVKEYKRLGLLPQHYGTDAGDD